MGAPQRRRPARRGGRANSDAERRALAKAIGYVLTAADGSLLAAHSETIGGAR